MNIHQFHIALNALDFWALFACMGLLVVRLWLMPASAFVDPTLDRRWHRLLGIGLAALTVTGIALLLVRTMEMAGSPLMESLPLVPQVLRQVHFGHVWSLHLIALVALWLGWAVSRRLSFEGGMGLMLAAALVLAFTYSASSHAADQGDFRAPEIIDWLHVLAASAWGGGIIASILFIFPALRNQRKEQWALIADIASRLSALSAFALMIVILSGLLNATLRLGDFGALITTPYGHILGIKLLLVAAMACIGAINRFFLVPKVQQWTTTPAKSDHALSQFRVALFIDTVLVLMVLIAAAALIQGMPPASMQGMPGMQHENMPGM